METRKPQKLTLRKEAIKTLSEKSLERVAGGETQDYCDTFGWCDNSIGGHGTCNSTGGSTMGCECE